MEDYIKETKIEGVYVIERPVMGDERGFFRETFRKNDLEKRLGYEFNIVQANHARSKKGILRGIHIAPWHKLVTVTRGNTQQVVVDCREDSPTFGKHISINIGDDNRVVVFIPANCGNAYLVLSEDADYTYLTSDYWTPGREKSIAYDDPTLNIDWQDNNPSLSDKDLANPSFEQAFKKE